MVKSNVQIDCVNRVASIAALVCSCSNRSSSAMHWQQGGLMLG